MKRLTIRVRLFIVLVVSILATTVVAVFGIINVNRISDHISVINNQNVVPLNNLVSMTHYFDTLRSYLRDAVITPDPAKTQEHLATVGRLYEQLVEISNDYLRHMERNGITTGDEYRTISIFTAALPGAAEIVGKVAERAAANDQETALRIIEEECVPYNTRLSDYLTLLAVHNRDQSQVMADAAASTASNALAVMTSTTIVSVIVLLILIMLVIQSITKPIRRLLDASEKLKNGNLNINFDTSAKDEIGELARSLGSVTGTLNSILGDINHMYSRHDEHGDVSYMIDTGKFNGSYKEVAAGVNQMVSSYIKICEDILSAMEHIANGDMMVKLPQYKGEKADINKSVNKVIATIKNIADTINTLAKAGVDGKLNAKADVSKFNGEWAVIAGELNGLMEAFGGATNETVMALDELSKGNFSHRITSSYQGEYDKIKQAVNNTGEFVDSYIEEVSEILGHITKGDLTRSITREYKGDFTSIKTSINNITQTLRDTIKNIMSASDQVSSGSSLISQSAITLAQGASEQTVSIQELTDNINEINNQTHKNSQNAQQATALANTSKNNAETGNTEMSALLTAIDGIKSSSDQIGKIIKTIEDIAFQTNLLALNASIEAAHAGDHGRGFAVVAEEVRNLANKSNAAAKETSNLIAESIARVTEGTDRANDTAASLSEIVKNVDEVADVINKIHEASEQQTASINNISTGIRQITQVVQSNSATSQESAASSEELNSQADTLKELIGFFRIR